MRTAVTFLLAALLVAGCDKSDQSTRISVQQYERVVPQLSEDMLQSAFLQDRGPQDPPVVIAITQVKNLTTDVIPLSTQWGLMQQLASRMTEMPVCRERSIRFQVPADRGAFLRRYSSQPLIEADLSTAAAPPPPTHIMGAVFRSIRRVDTQKEGYEKAVQTFYMLEAQITDVRTREIVWHGSLDFTVEASGLSID